MYMSLHRTALFGLLLAIEGACAATTYVSPGTDTLQAAIDSAASGDTLILRDGTYTSTAPPSGPFAVAKVPNNKDLTIQAENAGSAIIDGEDGSGSSHTDSDRRGLEIQGAIGWPGSNPGIKVTLRGLTIKRGYVKSQDGA